MTRSCCSSSNRRCPGLGSATSTLSFSRRADSPRTPSYGPQTSAWQTSPHASGSSINQPSTLKEDREPLAIQRGWQSPRQKKRGRCPVRLVLEHGPASGSRAHRSGSPTPLRRPDLQGCWRPGTGASGSSEWLVARPEILREGCCAVQVLAAGFKDGARAGGLLGARRWVCAAGAAATLACL